MKLRNIKDVAELQMCTGCGACAYMSPDEIKMVDVLDHGRRPQIDGPLQDPRSAEAFAVCPGASLQHDFDAKDPELETSLVDGWGPVRELWEGHASDGEVRFKGSSGGAATALAMFCMEQQGMGQTLHINSRPDVPYLNETITSTDRDGLLAATGSRYAPASPCDRLQDVEDADKPSVMIGKPCDIAAAHNARKLRPQLDDKLGLTIAIFCAGTPNTAGTLEMLRQMGVTDPTTLQSVRYRGRGWPGNAAAEFTENGTAKRSEMTYAESWGDILQKTRQWRCYLCLDHTGEFADIAVGDPWHKPIPPGEPGRSLVLARTERGRRILHAAMEAGYLKLERVEPEVLAASQTYFEPLRGKIWGRLLALRLAGAPAPRYRKMPMFTFWMKLSFSDKIRSVLGTWRRIVRKKLRRRVQLDTYQPPVATPPPQPERVEQS